MIPDVTPNGVFYLPPTGWLTSFYNPPSYNREQNAHLTSIGNTVISPLGVYSHKYQKIQDLPEGATIAIPNEPTTLGRGLNVLQSTGLIKVTSFVKLS